MPKAPAIKVPFALQSRFNVDHEGDKAWKRLSTTEQRAHIERILAVTTKASRSKRAFEVMLQLNPARAPVATSPATKGKGGARPVPPDLQKRFDDSYSAREMFGKLSQREQQGYIAFIEEAKTQFSRGSRLERTITSLIVARSKRAR
jgi:uncharacterized protein YdeI (YjbR/CyaY-like superfamily)